MTVTLFAVFKDTSEASIKEALADFPQLITVPGFTVLTVPQFFQAGQSKQRRAGYCSPKHDGSEVAGLD